MSSTVRIEPPAAPDWAELARLHALGLPHGFFAQLGPRFLAAYLRTYHEGPRGVARVARLDGRVVGFVVGSTAAREHSRWVVRRRGLRLAGMGVSALVAHPTTLATFVRTRLGRYVQGIWRRVRPGPLGGDGQGADADRGAGEAADAAVLRHVVVASDARGQGVGGTLVEAFTDELRRRGVARATLITRADEGGAGGLYERLGWRCEARRRAADGRLVLEYARDLA